MSNQFLSTSLNTFCIPVLCKRTHIDLYCTTTAWLSEAQCACSYTRLNDVFLYSWDDDRALCLVIKEHNEICEISRGQTDAELHTPPNT